MRMIRMAQIRQEWEAKNLACAQNAGGSTLHERNQKGGDDNRLADIKFIVAAKSHQMPEPFGVATQKFFVDNDSAELCHEP